MIREYRVVAGQGLNELVGPFEHVGVRQLNGDELSLNCVDCGEDFFGLCGIPLVGVGQR